MRQFDVCRNPSERSRPVAPFVVILQSHPLPDVPTVVVAPMLLDDGRSAYSGASVRVLYSGSRYVLSIPELAGIDTTALRGAVGSVAEQEDEIRRALDRLFTGF